MVVTTIVLVLSLILFLDYILKKRRNDMTANIPGPRQIPIFGNYFMFRMRNAKDVERVMKEQLKMYNGFVRSWFFNELNLLVANPEQIELVLNNSKHVNKSYWYEVIRSWLGHGLLTSKASVWRSRRKTISPAFYFKNSERFLEIFDRHSSVLVEQLKKHSNSSQAFNVHSYITLTTLDIFSESAMGVKINAQTGSNNAYVKAVSDMSQIVTNRLFNIVLHNDLFFNIFAHSEKQKENRVLKVLHGFCNHVIEERQRYLQKHTIEAEEAESDIGLKKKVAFLDILLRSTINGEPLSNTEIREEVDTFMFGGHDTTNTAISFTLYLLSRHPHVQNRLFEEVRKIIGNDRDRPVTYADLQEMKYMECVIKESMRMYQPVPIIGREVMEDTRTSDYTIPRGTVITIPIFLMMKNPKYFPDPERFDPDRHSLENGLEKINPYAYIPFSAGIRNCIGQKFAMMEMKSVISKVIRHFELLPMGDAPEVHVNIVIKSSNGIHIGIKDRVY